MQIVSDLHDVSNPIFREKYSRRQIDDNVFGIF